MQPIARAAILAVALAALLTAGYSVNRVRAATINVPCGAANLITAIETANNEGTNPGPDTLELAAGCTYTLTSAFGGGQSSSVTPRP